MYRRDPGLWQRLVSLEARASLRQTFFSIIYLPVVYTVFGALLGKFTCIHYQVSCVLCFLAFITKYRVSCVYIICSSFYCVLITGML